MKTDPADARTAEQLRGRIGSALLRVAQFKERLAGQGGPRAIAPKLVDELRKLANDLEQGFGELQDAMARCARERHRAAMTWQRAELLVEVSPVPCLLIDSTGVVIEANPAAGRALNVSHGRLPGKHFLLFVNGGREQFLARVAELLKGDYPSRWTVSIRPREHSLTQVVVVASPQGDDQVMIMLLPLQEAGLPTAADAATADGASGPGEVGLPGASLPAQ